MMMVGTRGADDVQTVELPDRHERFGWAQIALQARDSVRPLLGRVRGVGRLHELLHAVGRPRRLWDRLRGVEDWNLPASWRVLELAPERPDLIHAHNLHSFRGSAGHFDLRALALLSRAVPVVLTLHDAWLTTGHCAHSLGCGRWENGCGDCPDLTLYPPVRRDATAENWRRKKEVFAVSRLYVTAPCKWLLDRAERSMLAPAIAQSRVIANGIDRTVFTPGSKAHARVRLGLPGDAHILLYAGQTIKAGSYRDFPTLKWTVAKVAERLRGKVLLIALGENLPAEPCGAAEIRFVPFLADRNYVADHYRAADVYVHPARAETFPTTILEAMACATPVVATNVGGIPEQVSSETGMLVPAGDAEAMAAATVRILMDAGLAQRLGDSAAERVRHAFDLDSQADKYLDWFETIHAAHAGGGGAAVPRGAAS